MDETYVPTQRSQACQDARVSQEDVDQGGPSSNSRPSGQGPSTPVGLSAGTHGSSPRLGRIDARDTFVALRRSPHRGRSGPIAVRFLPDEGSGSVQAAYAISRKVGNAVVRNRLRRRMRAIIAAHTGDVPPGAYVFSSDPAGAELRFDQLELVMVQAVERAVRRAHEGQLAPQSSRRTT